MELRYRHLQCRSPDQRPTTHQWAENTNFGPNFDRRRHFGPARGLLTRPLAASSPTSRRLASALHNKRVPRRYPAPETGSTSWFPTPSRKEVVPAPSPLPPPSMSEPTPASTAPLAGRKNRLRPKFRPSSAASAPPMGRSPFLSRLTAAPHCRLRTSEPSLGQHTAVTTPDRLITTPSHAARPPPHHHTTATPPLHRRRPSPAPPPPRPATAPPHHHPTPAPPPPQCHPTAARPLAPPRSTTP